MKLTLKSNLLLVVFITILFISFIAVASGDITKVQTGWTKAQVEQEMGVPESVYSGVGGMEVWTYSNSNEVMNKSAKSSFGKMLKYSILPLSGVSDIMTGKSVEQPHKLTVSTIYFDKNGVVVSEDGNHIQNTPPSVIRNTNQQPIMKSAPKSSVYTLQDDRTYHLLHTNNGCTVLIGAEKILPFSSKTEAEECGAIPCSICFKQ